MPTSFTATKLFHRLLVLFAFVLAGGWLLRSQQQPAMEKRPAPAGTIRAMLENPEIKGDINLGLTVEFPQFQTLEQLADASDTVVRGLVTASRSYPCQQMQFLCTEFRVKVLQVLGGSVVPTAYGQDRILTIRLGNDAKPVHWPAAPDEILVAQGGGQLLMEGRRVRATITDWEMLRNGDQYILFLKFVGDERERREFYTLNGGPQAAIEVRGEELRSLISKHFYSHPIRFEVERLLKSDRQLLFSHFEQRLRRPRP